MNPENEIANKKATLYIKELEGENTRLLRILFKLTNRKFPTVKEIIKKRNDKPFSIVHKKKPK